MSNAIAPINQFQSELVGQTKQIQSSLPAGMDVNKFMRTAVNGITMHQDSAKLLKADRQSLMLSIQKAAADGLMLDGREAALVVFGGTATYMPMTQGLIKLARNSGDIKNIEAYVVFQNDDFTYRPALDDEPVYEPDWKTPPSERGVPVLAYAVIALKDGEKIVRVLHAEEIMTIAAGTKNKSQYDPKTGNHYKEWWKKTAVKAALKYAPKASELESAISHDNEGYDFDAGQQKSRPMKTVSDINAELDEKPKAQKPKADPAPENVDTETGEVTEPVDAV